MKIIFYFAGILEQVAANGQPRDAVAQQIGDFYAACMDEAAVGETGNRTRSGYLDAVGSLKT